MTCGIIRPMKPIMPLTETMAPIIKEDVGPNESDGEIGTSGQAAHEPEEQPLCLIEINDRVEKHDHGGNEGIKNHAGKQQMIGMQSAVEQREPIDQHHAAQRADKCR